MDHPGNCDSHVEVLVQLESGAQLPEYHSESAAGMDLRAFLNKPITIRPGERALIPTGLRMAIPPGYEGQVRPRSGLAFKQGLTLLNTPGTIDADYRGEIQVLVINLGQEPVVIKPGERIAQLVIAPVARARLTVVQRLPETGRGEGGFGHTGTE